MLKLIRKPTRNLIHKILTLVSVLLKLKLYLWNFNFLTILHTDTESASVAQDLRILHEGRFVFGEEKKALISVVQV